MDEQPAESASDMIADALAERPYHALGLAACVGFALGGGLRMSARSMLALAGRFLLSSFVEPALRGTVAAAVTRQRPAHG